MGVSMLDMARKFAELQIEAIGTAVVTEYAIEIVDTLKYQLFEESVDGNGNTLRTPYSNIAGPVGPKGYRTLKREMRGKEITDLYLTGEFYAAMVLTVSGGEYSITSNDSKTVDIVKWANAPIFCLSLDSKAKVYTNFIRPAMTLKIAEITGCGIS